MTDKDVPQEYQVVYGKGFLKDLKRIIKGGNKSIKSNVQNAIQKLKSNPHKKRSGLDIKLISKREDSTYRIRLGKYRMVYEIDENEKKIYITMLFIREHGY